MNIPQKVLGSIFPPYKFSVLRREQRKFFKAIISYLPDDFKQIRDHTLKADLMDLKHWVLYPDFKLVSSAYPGETIFSARRRGQNFKISGLEIFSKRNNRFEDIEILVQDNLVHGLKITNSDYQLSEFDLNKITNENVIRSSFEFPPGETDIFYNSLSQEIKEILNIDDLFDVDFNNRKFYSFYDLEDGNYLAVDKSLKVYSLVHDARPMAMSMKVSFIDILNDISGNQFDKEKHLIERYKNSK